MEDFIEEVINLTDNGVIINRRKYSFNLLALIADSQARAFIKCIKAPGGYYSCERCETKGLSVGEKQKQVKVYPEMDAKKRNRKSFKKIKQEEHHKKDSPLLRLKNFDPVKSIVIDSVHLLFLGVMKSLLEKWVIMSSMVRLKRSQVQRLRHRMFSLKNNITCYFQRKHYDINQVSR